MPVAAQRRPAAIRPCKPLAHQQQLQVQSYSVGVISSDHHAHLQHQQPQSTPLQQLQSTVMTPAVASGLLLHDDHRLSLRRTPEYIMMGSEASLQPQGPGPQQLHLRDLYNNTDQLSLGEQRNPSQSLNEWVRSVGVELTRIYPPPSLSMAPSSSLLSLGEESVESATRQLQALSDLSSCISEHADAPTPYHRRPTNSSDYRLQSIIQNRCTPGSVSSSYALPFPVTVQQPWDVSTMATALLLAKGLLYPAATAALATTATVQHTNSMMSAPPPPPPPPVTCAEQQQMLDVMAFLDTLTEEDDDMIIDSGSASSTASNLTTSSTCTIASDNFENFEYPTTQPTVQPTTVACTRLSVNHSTTADPWHLLTESSPPAADYVPFSSHAAWGAVDDTCLALD